MERIKAGEILRSNLDGEIYKVESTKPDETRVVRMIVDYDDKRAAHAKELKDLPMAETGDVKIMRDEYLAAWFNRSSPNRNEWAMEQLAWDLRKGDVMLNLFDGEPYKIQEKNPDSITVVKVREERYADGTVRYPRAEGAEPEVVLGDDIRSSFAYRTPGRERQMKEIEARPAGSPHIIEYVKSIPADSQDYEAMQLAAEKSPASTVYMHKDFQERFLPDAIKKDPTIIKDISDPSEDLQYEAVKANPYAVYLINNPAQEVVSDAERRLSFNGVGITKLRSLMNPQEREAMSNKRKVELAIGKGVKLPSKGVDRNLLRMTSRITLPKINIGTKLESAGRMARETLRSFTPGKNDKSGPGIGE